MSSVDDVLLGSFTYSESLPDPFDYEHGSLIEYGQGSAIREVFVCKHNTFKDENGEKQTTANWEYLFTRQE